MENQKKKLRLEDIKVESFVTSSNDNLDTIQGGTRLTWTPYIPDSITVNGVWLGALCNLVINPPELGGSDTPDCRSRGMREHCDTVLETIVVLPGGSGSGITVQDMPKIEFPEGLVSRVGNPLCLK